MALGTPAKPMAMVARSLAALAAVGQAASFGHEAVKQVLNTVWWPPGTERTAESVGILSHGFIFMTAMMERNSTWEATSRQELLDVRDIANAGGADLQDLVDCVVNAPSGQARVLREAMLAALPRNMSQRPVLTVVEMAGEYTFFATSANCVAAVPGEGERRSFSHRGAYGVAANGLLHLSSAGAEEGATAERQTRAALEKVRRLIHSASGGSLRSLVDCMVFLKDLSDAQEVRSAFKAARASPALTVVQAGLEDPKALLQLRCVAALEDEAQVSHEADGAAVQTQKFVFPSGQIGVNTNGTDAFKSLEQILGKHQLGLKDVVNCVFFIRDTLKVMELFEGFSLVFNQENPPPPSRGEFTALSERPNGAVVVKCIAARPNNTTEQQLLVV